MAVNINNLSPYKRLLAHLYPDTSDPSAVRAFNNSPDYKARIDAREKLEGALRGDNGENPKDVVAQLALLFAPQILDPFNVKPEDVAGDFEKTQSFSTQEQAPQTETTTSPLSPADSLPKESGSRGEGGHGQDPKTKAEDALKISQKEATLKAF